MQKSEKAAGSLCKTGALILYALPVIFLVAAYFLMTVTSEDMLQGAGLGSGYIERFFQAFRYNSRLGDMYAWPAIRGFDYQFGFGLPDAFLRAADVLMGTAVVYLAAVLVLGGRPKLLLKDGTVFCLTAAAIFLNPWCGSLFLAFSHIHNYLIICFFSLLFFLPFVMKIRGRRLPPVKVMALPMLICGFMFGFSSNVTPAAFLLTAAITAIAALLCKKAAPRDQLRSWELWAVAGTLLACGLMYLGGSGVSAYTGDAVYVQLTDYISVSQAIAEPGRLAVHLLHNLYVAAPCILSLIFVIALELAGRRFGVKNAGGFEFPALCLLFVLANCLAMVQIRMDSMIRLFMPACIVTAAAVLASALNLIKRLRPGRAPRIAGAVGAAALLLTATADMAEYRLSYTNAVAPVLESIRVSEGDTAYFPRALCVTEKSKIFGFYQEPMVAEWTKDVPIYGKHVEFTD